MLSTPSNPALNTLLSFLLRQKMKVAKKKGDSFKSLRVKKEALRCFLKPYSPTWHWFFLPIVYNYLAW